MCSIWDPLRIHAECAKGSAHIALYREMYMGPLANSRKEFVNGSAPSAIIIQDFAHSLRPCSALRYIYAKDKKPFADSVYRSSQEVQRVALYHNFAHSTRPARCAINLTSRIP